MTNIRIEIEQVDTAGFDELRKQWDVLLSRSTADPLVMSWPWQRIWWKTFGESSSFRRLKLLCARGPDGKLIGIAPLYLETNFRFGMRFRRLQFVANSWRDDSGIRSEYVDFITDVGHGEAVISAFLRYINEEMRWDEFVICNHWIDSQTMVKVDKWCSGGGFIVRRHEKGFSYRVELQGDFHDFLGRLNGKARRQIYNQRKQLAERGKVCLRKVTAADDIEAAFDTLNDFHKRRWGRPVFAELRKAFHVGIARDWLKRDVLEFTILCIDDHPISALYDLVAGNVKYGIQMGFDSRFDKRLSPAKLHIGYSLESAYDRGFATFDLLRGTGRDGADYKTRFAQRFRGTETVQIIRSSMWKLMYRIYDSARGKPHRSAG